MKIGCAQLAYRALDAAPGVPRVEANLAYLQRFYRSREPVDLLILGEFWLSSPNGAADYPACAVSADEVEPAISTFARENSVHVLANVVERGGDGTLYDSSLLLDARGSGVMVYREVAAGILPGSVLASPIGSDVPERGLAAWTPVVDTEIGRVGAVVGSDLAYPELFTAMTMDGVELVLHSAKEPRWAGGPWQHLKAARCIEGAFFLASCNIADSSAVVGSWGESFGGSRIIGPDGTQLAATDSANEAYVVTEISYDHTGEAREAARIRRRVSAAWAAQCAAIYHNVPAAQGRNVRAAQGRRL